MSPKKLFEIDVRGIKELNGGLGRLYKVVKLISFQWRRHRTPTVTYAHAPQVRPYIWKTTQQITPAVWRVFFPSAGKEMVVKGAPFRSRQLVNEARALARLQKWKWLSKTRMAPKLYQGVKRDKRAKIYFFAAEWLGLEDDGRAKKWEYLAKVLNEYGPLATEDLLQLQRALDRGIRFMHRRGVIHGDIKDEHVVVKVVRQPDGQQKYDFSTIRFLDFGASYFREDGVVDWNGATPGFCPPYLWDIENRWLSINTLRWLDWYGSDALLYLALTGECFPITSPPYKDLLHKREYLKDYLKKLRESLFARIEEHWGQKDEWPRRALAYWLIQRLGVSDPDQIDLRPFYQPRLLLLTGRLGWIFLGVLLSVFLLNRYFLHLPSLGVGLTLLGGLAAWRWVQDEKFFVTEESDWKRWVLSSARWKEIAAVVIWFVGGLVALPGYFFPAFPVILGLLTSTSVKEKFKRVVEGGGIVLALWIGALAVVVWRPNALAVATGWSLDTLLAPGSPLIIWVGWVLSWGVTQLRSRTKRIHEQWGWVLLGVLISWLLPVILRGGLAEISRLNIAWWLSGVMSLVLVILTGTYATWFFINVDPDKEREDV